MQKLIGKYGVLTKIVLAPYRWLFVMPPVRERPEIKNFLRYFIYMDYDRRYNEAYVYYKVFMTNLWMNLFFFSAYYVSFAWRINIDLGIFTIRYRPDAPVDELVYGYPLYVFPILMILTILQAALLFLLRTDYWSKERILREKTPVLNSNKKLYDIKPINFIIATPFLIGSGFYLWSFVFILRDYKLYNFIHNFHDHNESNFTFFLLLYFVFYQTLYCQAFIHVTSEFTRSVLRHYVYRKHFKPREEPTDAHGQ